MKHLRYLTIGVTLFIALSCKEDNNKPPKSAAETATTNLDVSNDTETLFEYLEPSVTNIDFKNQIIETEQFNFLLYEYLYNGGGVAIGDVNNDGLDDIYFSGNTVPNTLYLNQGDFKFKDITETAKVDGGIGFKTGVSMADVNNDGFLDIYVCKSALNNDDYRKNMLYINNGDLTFTESAKAYGLDDAGYSVQAYFFDSDGDNDLDVFVLNHPSDMKESNALKVTQNSEGKIVKAQPTKFEHVANRFYQNNNNKFTDVSKKAGVLDNTFSLSAVVGDFNNDFKPDIYICNDYMEPDRLFINQGNNRFTDKIDDYFSHTSFSSMGSDFADINNNGHFDLLTLDMSPKKNDRRKMMMMVQNYDKYEKMINYGFGTQFAVNALQINTGAGHFSDIAFLDNVAQTEWSWSALFADFNNDGFKDLHVTNGYKRDVTNNDYSRYRMDVLQKQLNAKEITLKQWIEQIPSIPVSAFLFKNQGQNQFKDVSNIWNSGKPSFSNGSAYSDLNNDGFLDVVVSNINEAPFVMKNKGKTALDNNYLLVNLVHKKGVVNTGALAKLYLSDGTILTEQYNPTRGFLSSSHHRLHFGIPSGLEINKLEIIWPDKSVQIIETPELNQILSVSKNPNSKFSETNARAKYITDVSSKLNSAFSHTENAFIDFKREILLHRKYSEEGPAVAIGDVNGDGLEDVFLGGAIGYPATLFFQTTSGSFKKQSVSDFETDKNVEDVDAVFFDANADGHLDLFVVSGGNEYDAKSNNYKDRFYLNDGSGNFSSDTNAIPNIFRSGSSVAVNDIDNDGQPDLFIGSRVTPGRYPELPKSYILKNENGTFKDVTSSWLKNASDLGMITDVEFADLNNDGKKELIIVGEWTPIMVFEYVDGSFQDKTQSYGLNNHEGWWNSITIDDINNDGYNDIIAGNLGLNTIFKASDQEPATLYYKDYDNNGSVDPILCNYIEGISYPIHSRDRMLSHMVFLKKRFTRYEPYSNATINDIFTPEELEGSKILKANHFEHTLFLNDGGTNFKAQALPVDTQISVMNDAVVIDVNNDGKKDIITAGNFFGTDAEFGRYDASIGNLLINSEKGLQAIPAVESGLSIPGNVQHLKPIVIQGEQHLLVVRNNERCSLIKLLK